MALASNIVIMMFAQFLEDKMETIKVEIAKKLLELRIKIQLGMEVDIPMELDKLALEILNIEPETQIHMPYNKYWVYKDPLIPKDPYKPPITNGDLWTVSCNNPFENVE